LTLQAFGIDVSKIALAFNDPEGVPPTPVNPERRPQELAEEFSGPGTHFTDPEAALKGKSYLIH
jgi:hypothetical protein